MPGLRSKPAPLHPCALDGVGRVVLGEVAEVQRDPAEARVEAELVDVLAVLVALGGEDEAEAEVEVPEERGLGVHLDAPRLPGPAVGDSRGAVELAGGGDIARELGGRRASLAGEGGAAAGVESVCARAAGAAASASAADAIAHTRQVWLTCASPVRPGGARGRRRPHPSSLPSRCSSSISSAASARSRGIRSRSRCTWSSRSVRWPARSWRRTSARKDAVSPGRSSKARA